jgi:RNA recognition motif-containing protein
MRLCIRNLPLSLTADQLCDLVAPYSPNAQIQLSLNDDTGRSHGFGFVEIADAAAAQRALTGLNRLLIQGHRLVVEPAYRQGSSRAPQRETRRVRREYPREKIQP